VVSCGNIFNHLGKMPDSYIIFCDTQKLLEFYLLDKKQQTIINGLYRVLCKGRKYLHMNEDVFTIEEGDRAHQVGNVIARH